MKITQWGLGLLSLVTLLASVPDADAFFHHCGRGCGHCRRHCFETHICCRAYNAFTPICWGNLYCDGCCPNPCSVASGAACMPNYGACMPAPVCASFGGCMPGGMPGYGGPCAPGIDPGMGGPLPSLPAASPLPPGPPSTNGVPPVLNHAAQYGNYGNPAAYYGVQPAGYYPGYYGYPTGYYPNAYYPNAYQAGYYPYQNWGAAANPYYGYGYGYGYGNGQRSY